MKFWHKIFIGTLIIFMLAFDAGAYFLISHSYNFNKQGEIESGIREQDAILSSLASRLSRIEEFYPDLMKNKERLAAVVKPLADYYRRQGVLLALFDGDTQVYAELSGIDKELLQLENAQSKNVADKLLNQKRYALVASSLPQMPGFTLVYARDISQVDVFRTDISRVFVVINAVVLLLQGAAVYLLLRRMTKPITELETAAAEIAGGDYQKRVVSHRTDELGALAYSFNRMADSVEEKLVQLTRTAQEKQQFIDDLTHEMKTPMTSILGYSEYLQNVNSTDEERITAAGHLRRAVARFKNLSDKLLELVLLRGERLELKPVDIQSLFGVLDETMRPGLAARNMTLSTFTNLAQINGDEALLLSMLTNLAENAAKASKEGSAIVVKAYTVNELPVIEVSDTGCGMPPGELDKITAPFYRVDKSRSRELGGVGLGLSIVAQIAALHGAKMEIQSKPDVGTTVRICFTTI